MISLKLEVNGQAVATEVAPATLLIDLLRGPLALAQTVRQRPQRDWAPWAGDIGGDARGDPRGLSADSSGAAVPQADLRVLQDPLRRTAEWVRDNRAWLIGGLVLGVLLAAALKLFSRRI